ncbi:MAG: hypothetical protein OCC49_20115 [Fibrobacterales bacterium]
MEISEPEYTEFTKSIIAFVDILGFDSEISSIKSEKDFKIIAKTLSSLKQNADAMNNSEYFNKFEVTAISDSVIVSVPFDEPLALISMIHYLSHLQFGLIGRKDKMLLRGYVNVGMVYHKNGIVFGEGYSKAYAMESKIDSAPRIVISPELIDTHSKPIETISSNGIESIYDYLIEDPSDGLYYIDYLQPHGNEDYDIYRILLRIQKFIHEKLAMHVSQPRIYMKYKWLENYYNFIYRKNRDNFTKSINDRI